MLRVVLALALLSGTSDACSNLLITPGASADGSSMISYNADSGTLYGSLYHYPKATHSEGDMRQVYDWDSGRYLGEIPEASETYNVISNINEWGLVRRSGTLNFFMIIFDKVAPVTTPCSDLRLLGRPRSAALTLASRRRPRLTTARSSG